LPSLHFLVEPETLSNQSDRRIFVARQNERVIGFLNLSPVPQRNGWLVEQFVRDEDAPNGTIELMLEHAARVLANGGFSYLTLGLSPLTHHAGPQLLPERSSSVIRFLLGWARAHGRRFYNFEGLEFFKTKFEPESWESVYAISKREGTRDPDFSLRALYAIACAFTKGHPVATVAAGIARAIKQEVLWLFRAR
jgi:phosphatidylglycerol lysyltransferase